MQRFISSDGNLEGHRRDDNDNDNDNNDDPLSPRLRQQFDTLCAIQRQSMNGCSDDPNNDDGEFLAQQNAGHDNDNDIDEHDMNDDEYYEALFSTSSSIATNGHKRKRTEPFSSSSPFSSVALSTSILAQREIDEVRNGIAELEEFLRRGGGRAVGNGEEEKGDGETHDGGDGADGGGRRIDLDPCLVAAAHDEMGALGSLDDAGRGRHGKVVVRSAEAGVVATVESAAASSPL